MAMAFSPTFVPSFTDHSTAHLVTPPPTRPTPKPGDLSPKKRKYGQVDPARLFGKRNDPQTDCDGQHVMFCPTGTCYTGSNTYVGCCTVSSCAPRTTCIDHIPSTTSVEGCDLDTGGCVYCSDPAAPACVTFSNVLEDQYMMYCDKTAEDITSAWVNLHKIADSTSASTTSSSNSQSSSITTSSSTPTITSVSTPHTSVPVGAVVGIAVGAIAATAIFAVLCFFFLWLRARRQRGDKATSTPEIKTSHHSNNDEYPPSLNHHQATGRGLGMSEAEGSTPLLHTPDSSLRPASTATVAGQQHDGTQSIRVVSELDSLPISLPDTPLPSYASLDIRDATADVQRVRPDVDPDNELFPAEGPGSATGSSGSGTTARSEDGRMYVPYRSEYGGVFGR